VPFKAGLSGWLPTREKLTEDEVRRYLLHLKLEKKIARGSFSVVLGGLRFFYHKALGRDWRSLYVAKPRSEKKLPVVLSRDEVWRVLDFITFTLPAELRSLARSHQDTVYDLLLREAAAALQLLADDPKWVGAKLGIQAVLHTWSRDLSYHPHVHLLATAGGLTDQGKAWRKPAHSRFLVPGYALSTIFRAKVRDALDRENLLGQVDPAVFRKAWNVHLEHAGDGEHAAEYLSRYAHRVALTNDRIEAFEHGRVTFRYISSRTHQTQRLTLPVQAFIARFLQHVLPKGFQKIRGYGLFRPAATRQRQRARHLLELDPALPPNLKNSPAPTTQPVGETPDLDRRRLCPACRKGHLVRLRTFRRPPPPSLCADTTRAPPPS
jgi:putative transposase/integrase-like protein